MLLYESVVWILQFGVYFVKKKNIFTKLIILDKNFILWNHYLHHGCHVDRGVLGSQL